MNPNDNSGQPQHVASEAEEQSQAADLIRKRLEALYSQEPSSNLELNEVEHVKHRSRHQNFMHELNESGKSATEIQTAWHEYYQGLTDEEKHQVWREFNENQQLANQPDQPDQPEARPSIKPGYYHEEKFVSSIPVQKSNRRADLRTVAEIKHQLLSKVKVTDIKRAKRHFKSLLFGIGVGSFVVLVMLFGFFNERFIAPFITPSKNVSSTPIILSSNTTTTDPEPKVIIPKINVEIPVVYDLQTTEEQAVQTALEDGVVHYATTPSPGQQGNVVIFGHSSNNIFNKGDYKFAFVLLSRLEAGDLFYLTKNGTRYAYKVYDKRIVKPTALEVLGPADKPDTATLITCDPPGTTLNRLVVTGEQISPDPTVNETTTIAEQPLPEILPSNAPSLWQRLTSWL